MADESKAFFVEKRPWSRVKDRILGSYLPAYLAKVNRLSKPIILIDAYAGPGVFEDGSPGSPVLMCKAAKDRIRGAYKTIFINNDTDHHKKLMSILEKGGWSSTSRAIFGDSERVLKELLEDYNGDETVFLYLDPFGLSCEFASIEPFLNRNRSASTEVLINLSMPIIHRMAGRNSNSDETKDLLDSRRNTLDKILGGDYWREHILGSDGSTQEREKRLIENYVANLSSNGYLKFTGYCPIQEARTTPTKYYMIFASTHRDARLLMNDEMIKSFNTYMNEIEMKGTLFAELPWNAWRDTSELKQIILNQLGECPGTTRLELWHHILEKHFFRFTSSEYKRVVGDLFKDGKIVSPTERKTSRLNDGCALYISDTPHS